MSNKRSGKCLCSAVTYEAELIKDQVHVCHCNICQNWHGGPGMAIQVKQNWKIDGEDNLTGYKSSEWAKRAFCSLCGTHMFFKTDDDSYYGVSAGSLDNKDGLTIDSHIFIDKKPSYYDFMGDAPRLTEDDFLKMVGAE